MPDYTFPVYSADARITSDIGTRVAPLQGASTNHRGIDIAAPYGSPVVAPTDLRVTFAGTARGYGNAVYGVDEYGNQFRFAHLSGFDVAAGDTISQGQQLGQVGSTGNSTGNHLHFEIRNRAGELLRDLTRRVVSSAQRNATDLIRQGGMAILTGNPVTGVFGDLAGGGGTGGLLSGSDCGINPICHLQKWFDDTEIVPRTALFIVGTIFIIGAIAFLAVGYNPKNIVQDIAKGAAA